MGTSIILPLALWTIWLKWSAKPKPYDELEAHFNTTTNELIEQDNGYFTVYIGTTTLCDYQGQQTTVKFENESEIAEYCRKHKIDVIKFNASHYL